MSQNDKQNRKNQLKHLLNSQPIDNGNQYNQ